MSDVITTDQHHARGLAPIPGVAAEPLPYREDPK